MKRSLILSFAPAHPRAMLAALVAAYTGLTTVSARAGQYWDGDAGGSFLWSDSTNWDSDTAPAYGTLVFAGGVGNTNVIDAAYSMNQVNWNGTSAWTLNATGAGALSLFDNGGTQAKLENNGTGVVTVNADVIFAANNASPPNPFGEINAINGGIVFGAGKTLTVNGSSVDGIKLWGGGQTTDFNGTVSASTKYFATTGTNTTMGVAGAFTSGDIYLMNGGVLKLNTGGSITTSGLRLGGDFGTTGNQDLTKGGTLQLTAATGSQSFAGNINSVSGNTSGALLIDSQNTSGTNTLSGNVFLDSDLASQTAAGGTLAYTGTTLDLKGNTFSVGGAGTTTIANTISNSIGTGKLTKTGAGALTLSGTNTYAGLTSINGGTVNISLAANLGDASATNTVSINGGALNATATLALGTNRSVAIGASGGTFGTSVGAALTVDGSISGSGALTVSGAGSTILSGNNSGFSGNVTVNSVGGNDTLRLDHASALTSGTVTANVGAAAAGSGTVVQVNNVAIGSGVGLVLNAAGTGNFRSTLIGTGAGAVWNGGITLAGDGNTGFNANGAADVLTINGNTTGTTGTHFLRGGAGAGILNGTLNITGNIAKTDGGIWTINSTGNSWG